MKTIEIPYTSTEEQQKIGDYLESIDHHITLHHHKLFFINGLKLFTAIQCKCYLLLNISNKNKKTKKEIESMDNKILNLLHHCEMYDMQGL